jgi:hypothetical protein
MSFLSPIIFYSVFENLGLIRRSETLEENFLMPNNRMKELLRQY